MAFGAQDLAPHVALVQATLAKRVAADDQKPGDEGVFVEGVLTLSAVHESVIVLFKSVGMAETREREAREREREGRMGLKSVEDPASR